MRIAPVVNFKRAAFSVLLISPKKNNEQITAKIENFKDSGAMLTMIQHIPGQWDMENCNMKYEKKDANTLEFEIQLPARSQAGPAVKELKMTYHRRHIRPGAEPQLQIMR